MGISFIHIADVHLGSPLVASSEEKQETINTAIEQALSQVVEVAIENEVDFIVIAGDLFDGHITNASLAAKFISIMLPASINKIHTYVLWGNHDAEGKHNLSFSDDEYLHFFKSSSPQTFTIDGKNIALHGQSFATQAVTDNLAVNYPSKIDGAYNIGVLHTSLDGREGHDTYAPCSLQDLKNKEYDYWALGHIHKRETVNEHRPTVVYSGNLQGRHTRENGDKGCYIVKIDEQHNVDHQFIPISKIVFLRESIDIDGVESEEEVVKAIREYFASNTKSAYLRLTFEGKTELSTLLETKMIETIRFELLAKNITLAKMKNNTVYPKSIEEIAEEKNTIGSMVSILREDSIKAETISIVSEELSYFKDISDYLPDEDSLYVQLNNDPAKAVETLVLNQLQKEIK